MAKYHLNWRGEAKPCNATIRRCHFGGSEDHFASPEEARSAYEGAQNSFSASAQKTDGSIVQVEELAPSAVVASLDFSNATDREMEDRKTVIFRKGFSEMTDADHLEIAVIVSEQEDRRTKARRVKSTTDSPSSWENLQVPDPSESKLILKPKENNPGGGYMGGSKFVGGKVSSSYTSAKDAAKSVRADLKEAIKAGELPNDLDFSVRMNSSQSGIQIYIGGKGPDGKARVLEDAEQQDDRMGRVMRYVESMGNQYCQDDSNASFDYFNSHNRARVSFRDRWS